MAVPTTSEEVRLGKYNSSMSRDIECTIRMWSGRTVSTNTADFRVISKQDACRLYLK